ncbi:MAG: RDD family protein [Gammaproteobacteria bacterium]|nr:RDD family protein [Gammaproteobacteria bacterium]
MVCTHHVDDLYPAVWRRSPYPRRLEELSLLDTSYRVEIPGGIELEAQVVGPVARFLAFSIDFAIRGILLIVSALASIPFGELGFGFWFIFWFFIEWFYPVLFEVFRRGQTPGKKTLGISVVQDDLTPISFRSSLVRNLLRTADFLPFCYLFGLVTMVSNSRFQRLGDLTAGTLVISIRETAKPASVDHLSPLAPPTRLSRSEQTALVNFLHRSQQLSQPRQQELARILDDVTNSNAHNRVEQLHRIGAWLLGIR